MRTSLHSTRSPLRVAMILQGYLPRLGGAERQLAALAPRLRERGIQVDVLTRQFPGLAPFERIGGVPVHRLPAPRPKPVASLVFTISALARLHRLRPAVIHAHELLSPATTALLARQALHVPVVVKVLRGGTLGDLAKLRSKPLGRQRIAALVRGVDVFIAISREILAELAQAGAAPRQVAFIPNGVDTQRFQPLTPAVREALRRTLGLPDGRLVLFAGRLEPEKRLDQLVALWPQVRAAEPQAELLILGTGSQAAALHRLAGPGVHFLGLATDPAPFLQVADLFVLPSAAEGLSNALLEALAAGLPVVATEVGGASDVIVPGESGCLVPPDRPDLFAAAVRDRLADPEGSSALGRCGWRRVEQEFSLDSVVDRLVQLYHSLV